jgi:hypothetical protein
MQGTQAGIQQALTAVEMQGKDRQRLTKVNYSKFRNGRQSEIRLTHSNQKVTGLVSEVNRSETKRQKIPAE